MNVIKKFIASLILCCISSVANAADTIMTALEIKNNQALLTVRGPLKFRHMNLSAPERLVIDLPNTKTQIQPKNILVDKSIIQNLRISQNNNQSLRIVFDLVPGVKTLVEKGQQPNQLSIDFSGLNKPPLLLQSEKPTIRVPKANASQNNLVPVMTAPKGKMRDVIVTIDAGHGGKDPGAKGANGTQEKNVVLAISQELAAQINRQPGMRAVLTRAGDYYIGLRERLTAARKHNADLFIAIHADAYNKRDSAGASVFALSPHGASSEAARWLAERENHSELGDVSLTDKSFMLRSVLLDLSQTATIVDSLHLGDQVLSNLGNMTKLHNHKVEQAQFVVLKSPDIPSILVETGFITNPDEERKLSNPEYQETLARAIFSGVKSYFAAHPPTGTIFAAQNQEDIDTSPTLRKEFLTPIERRT